jgi:hypothetical protein
MRLDDFSNPHFRCSGSAANVVFAGLVGGFAAICPTVVLLSGSSGPDVVRLADCDLSVIHRAGQQIHTAVLEVANRQLAQGDAASPESVILAKLLQRIGLNRMRLLQRYDGNLIRMRVTPMGGPDNLAEVLGAVPSGLHLRATYPSTWHATTVDGIAATWSRTDVHGPEQRAAQIQAHLSAGLPPEAVTLYAYPDMAGDGFGPFALVGLRPDPDAAMISRMAQRQAILDPDGPLVSAATLNDIDPQLLADLVFQDAGPTDRYLINDVGSGINTVLSAMVADIDQDTEMTDQDRQANRAVIAGFGNAFMGTKPLYGLWEPGRPLLVDVRGCSPQRIACFCSLLIDERIVQREQRKAIFIDRSAITVPGVYDLGVVIARFGRRYSISLIMESLVAADPERPTLLHLLHGEMVADQADLSDLAIDRGEVLTGRQPVPNLLSTRDVASGHSLLAGTVHATLSEE